MKSTLSSPAEWVKSTIQNITESDLVSKDMNMKEIMQGINEVYNVLEGEVDSWKSLGDASTKVHKSLSLKGVPLDDFIRIVMFCGL